MEKSERYESAHWRVDVDEETGKPFWRGAGADDKDETVLDAGQPLILDPRHFPPGTSISCEEPWDERFYADLRAKRDKKAR